MQRPLRRVTEADVRNARPVHVVWELTLACNLKCVHCGSRAGTRRPGELTTEECLDLVAELAELGTREVTLIGGEAFLRRDWLQIIRAISRAGMRCTLQTGARNLTDERIRGAAEAGVAAVGVSVDGLRELHDSLRGVPGSFDQALDALRRLREHGIVTSVNTQITSLVIPELPSLLDRLLEVGVRNWQVQLTVAMGRAADNEELLMQPYEILRLMPLLAELYERARAGGIVLQPGNNVGYFGPYEHVLRGSGEELLHWTGCYAGRNVMGIESDGTIKGCPSLPTNGYTGGKLRERSVREIWEQAPELAFAREPDRSSLWGLCRTCYYAPTCGGGCTWTSHSLLGRPGNNPYCHYRALELAGQGLRERVVQVERAPGTSFDSGRFDIVLEDIPADDHDSAEAFARWVSAAAARRAALGVDSTPRPASPKPRPERSSDSHPHEPELVLCQGCWSYVYPGTVVCPHCGGDVEELRRAYDRTVEEARAACEALTKALSPETLAPARP